MSSFDWSRTNRENGRFRKSFNPGPFDSLCGLPAHHILTMVAKDHSAPPAIFIRSLTAFSKNDFLALNRSQRFREASYYRWTVPRLNSIYPSLKYSIKDAHAPI